MRRTPIFFNCLKNLNCVDDVTGLPVELEKKRGEDDRYGGESHGRATHPRLQLYLNSAIKQN